MRTYHAIMIEYMKNYPIRMNVRMTEIQRDVLQDKANKMGVSVSALLRLMINQIEPFKNQVL